MADSKPLVWLKGEIKSPPFSQDARLEAGFLLRRLQDGETLGMPDSRPMPSIGKRCHELRLRDQEHSWRIVYYIAAEAVVILEVFSKKSGKTPNRIIARCRDRLTRYQELFEED